MGLALGGNGPPVIPEAINGYRSLAKTTLSPWLRGKHRLRYHPRTWDTGVCPPPRWDELFRSLPGAPITSRLLTPFMGYP